MRRRRRSGGAWLPVNPTFIGSNPNGKTYFEDTQVFDAGPAVGDGVFEAIPLTLDDTKTVEAATDPGTLRDLTEGQDYTLNRLVGKVWCCLAQNGGSEVESCIACIGFAVLPTEPGASAPTLSGLDWNPLASQNAQEPWIWRRTWRLSNKALTTPSTDYPFPTNSAEYGSVLDGGHLDSKIKRRITREHRLYIVMGAEITGLTNDPEAEVQGAILMGYDIRLNGVMRRSKNSSSF